MRRLRAWNTSATSRSRGASRPTGSSRPIATIRSSLTDNPGEIFVGMHDANGDGIATLSPQPFIDMGDPIPMAVKNVNFLLKQDAPPTSFDVSGTVYADLNGDGIFNENDAPAPGIFVYPGCQSQRRCRRRRAARVKPMPMVSTR